MVWLAAKKIRKPIYQYGIVDESQDNSAMTFALLQASCENLMFFGDPNQAINAFAGADHMMFEKIENMADFTFPLKQTFRCPPAIVRRANEIRPGGVLEGPNKADAKIANIEHSLMQRMLIDLPPRDVLIVARTNASIISAALRLLTGDPYVDCHIPEKDLYKSTVKYIESLYPKSMDQLYDRLEEEKEKAAGMRNTIAAMNILDRCISIEYFMEQSDDLEDLFHNMAKVLQRKTGHKLLTLHSAKGLEAKNVFILNPPVEHPLALQNPISAEQEYNLHFVGITRSSLNLYYVK
jgi:superfamily I DNA/RNA helicase